MPSDVWIGEKPEPPRQEPTIPQPTLDINQVRETTYTGVVKIPNTKDVFLVTVGDSDRPAGLADLEDIENIFKRAFSKPGGKAIITHHAVKIKRILNGLHRKDNIP